MSFPHRRNNEGWPWTWPWTWTWPDTLRLGRPPAQATSPTIHKGPHFLPRGLEHRDLGGAPPHVGKAAPRPGPDPPPAGLPDPAPSRAFPQSGSDGRVPGPRFPRAGTRSGALNWASLQREDAFRARKPRFLPAGTGLWGENSELCRGFASASRHHRAWATGREAPRRWFFCGGGRG